MCARELARAERDRERGRDIRENREGVRNKEINSTVFEEAGFKNTTKVG